MDPVQASWRFIPFSEMNGAMNMALDVLFLEEAESTVPVLRLYGFSPPCISLGLNQKISEDSIKRTQERGFEIVRRPSGGRAVLHYKDLTYSFIACQKGHGSIGVLESGVSSAYKQICSGLQSAFGHLGLKTELGTSSSAYRNQVDCFLATTNADLHVDGLKLAGSAQLRRRNAVLQHGSIPLNLDQDLMAELLGINKSEERKNERHANLFELLGRVVPISELNEAMRLGFSSAFETSFSIREPDASELSRAEKLTGEFVLADAMS